MMHWSVNGAPADALSLNDRALHYGDGLFETIALRKGAPRFWDLHMRRLREGCERLQLDLPPEQDLHGWLLRTLERSGIDPVFGIAKIIVSAGQGRRGYRRPLPQQPSVLTGVFVARPWPVSAYEKGVATIVCRTPLAQQPLLAGLKSLNRLEQVMASSEWQDDSVAEGLMCDTDGRLICGTMSNVFLSIDDTLVTPDLSRCGVAGIMRHNVLEVAAASGIGHEVRDIHLSEIDNAKEVFLSNSQFGILPVRGCEQRCWPVGRTTQAVAAELARCGVAECRW